MVEMVRFFVVTVLGVFLDLAIAYGLHELGSVPLTLAAVIGFVCAASANYVAHQVWSFSGGAGSLSANRAVKYGAVAALTLVVRVGVVALLDAWLAGAFALLILICGAGVSFFVNFALSKFFVFAHASTREGA
ncbi:GtrA family protein [Erythrobacter sp. SCSIO 43205]|uniref:GtrA family protein n=1 Tax=Erythrobacter sp. SCSIO 43205 TaxID=2779361 RepID=UPI001CA85CD0|nr:GtrA family protein [Erythrobacter sp. SCSIO 43205]UAB79813.1 GtrA family protein [Erythrobacter sp. SCSIO 43205]